MTGPCERPECGGEEHPEAIRCPHAPEPDDFILEECPHCEAGIPRNRIDQHITEAHADLPPCTARIDNQHGLYACAFRAGHNRGEYGTWHASLQDPIRGRSVWNDTAEGAVPHAGPEPEPDELAHDDGHPEPPTEDELSTALPVRPDPRQPAYDAVYEYLRALGPYLPPDPVHRNAIIWRAVHTALDATPVGRCVSSHCVEGDHILPVESEAL